MKAFLFQGEIHCEDCAALVRDHLLEHHVTMVPEDLSDRDSYSNYDWPKEVDVKSLERCAACQKSIAEGPSDAFNSYSYTP